MSGFQSRRAPSILALTIGCLPWPDNAQGIEQPRPQPQLALANAYEEGAVELGAYWVSEKFDGIRAYWNGKQLLTRGGNEIHTPEWFVVGWPREPLDGELWLGRRQFETLSATVRDHTPSDEAWRRVRYLVFDLPAHPGRFEERLSVLQSLIAASGLDWLQAVPHWRVRDEADLTAQLQRLTADGAEGFMLRRASSFYRAERNDDLLKVKMFEDAEGRVVGHVPGQGKYLGMLGALELQTSQGVTFRIGTGLSDEQRRNPPALGSLVTFRYRGLTAHGIPRFASFLRVREEAMR
jgi:DNA ligase 1